MQKNISKKHTSKLLKLSSFGLQSGYDNHLVLGNLWRFMVIHQIDTVNLMSMILFKKKNIYIIFFQNCIELNQQPMKLEFDTICVLHEYIHRQSPVKSPDIKTITGRLIR